MTSTDRPYLRDFVRYLWEGEAPPAPLLRTEAHAVVTTGLPEPFRPMQLSRLPYGFIHVYPEWVAFLTSSRSKPGQIPAIVSKEMIAPVTTAIRMQRRLEPVPIAREVVSRTIKDERQRLEPLVANPNSIFIPLPTVTSAHQQRTMAVTVYLEITTNDRQIVMGPNSMFSFGPRMWKALKASYGGTWEPELLEQLQQAAQRNRSAQ